MAVHQLPVLRAERLIARDQGVGQGDHADVAHAHGQLQLDQRLRVEAELLTERHGQAADQRRRRVQCGSAQAQRSLERARRDLGGLRRRLAALALSVAHSQQLG